MIYQCSYRGTSTCQREGEGRTHRWRHVVSKAFLRSLIPEPSRSVLQTRVRELAGLGTFQFLAMNRRGVFYPFLSVYAYQRLGASLMQVGLLSALPMVASSITQPYWGRLSDRTGKRKLLIILGEAIAGVAYLLMMGLTEVWYLIIGLTALEGVWSMSNVGWSTLIIDVAKPSERGRVMGYLNTIGVGGMAFGVFAAGIMYDAAGFTLNFIISAAMMFVSAVVVWFWIRDRPTTEKPSVEPSADEGIERGNLSMLKMLILTNSLSMFGLNGVRQLMMIYMGSGLSFSGTLIGTISAAGSLADLALGIPVGHLSDRIDKKKLYIASLALNTATPAFLLFSQAPLHFVVISALVGMSWPLSETTAFPMAGEFAPLKDRGKFLGYFNAVRFLFGFGLPSFLLGGYVADYLKNMHVARGVSETDALVLSSKEAFLIAMIIALAGLLLWLPALRRSREESLHAKATRHSTKIIEGQQSKRGPSDVKSPLNHLMPLHVQTTEGLLASLFH